MGGVSETELNELIVSPTGLFVAGSSVVMTVTPEGKRPKAERKYDSSKLDVLAVINVLSGQAGVTCPGVKS